jgi:hypothetical protein
MTQYIFLCICSDSREWILNILLQGLRSRADWTIVCKVPIIRCLCCAFALEKIGPQRDILRVLANGAKIPQVAQEMVDKNSVLLWISNVNFTDKYYRRELEDVYRNLSLNCPSGGYRNRVFKFVSDKHKWAYSRDDNLDSDAKMDSNSDKWTISELVDV